MGQFCFVVMAAACFVPSADFLSIEHEVLRRLNGIELAANQAAQVSSLVQEFGPRILAAESQAALTELQRQARSAAIHASLVQGQRGLAARQSIDQAIALTAEQKSAAQQLSRLWNELDQRVLANLTDAQSKQLQQRIPVDDPADVPAYSGFIVVRLARGLAKPSHEAKTLNDVARELNLTQLQQLLVELQLTKSNRVVREVPHDLSVALERKAKQAEIIHRLESYWRVDVRGRDNSIDAIVRRLNQTAGIELAYRQKMASDPSQGATIDPGDDPYYFRQEYLHAAPQGIDAESAWTRPNGQGSGIKLVDVEQSWNPDHEDLSSHAPTLIYGDNSRRSDHGTAVLGELVAEDNMVGVIGAAPGVDRVFLSSWYHAGDPAPDVVGAITEALNYVSPGDVLLLEVQCDPGIPIEDDPMVRDAISLAVLYEVIVIEAAGNRGRNLDLHTDPSGKHIFDRFSPDCEDSGAIIVGASNPRDGHNRSRFSCYGSRVDCFAWGNNVTSCGRGDLAGGSDPNRWYTRDFNGTSSAVPIVAGAAVLLQGIATGNSSRTISPEDMRAFLSTSNTATVQGLGVEGAIGVMPNLRLIVEENSELFLGGPTSPVSRIALRGAETQPLQMCCRKRCRRVSVRRTSKCWCCP